MNAVIPNKQFLLIGETYEFNKTHDAWCSDNTILESTMFKGLRPPATCEATHILYNSPQQISSGSYSTHRNDESRVYFICQ